MYTIDIVIGQIIFDLTSYHTFIAADFILLLTAEINKPKKNPFLCKIHIQALKKIWTVYTRMVRTVIRPQQKVKDSVQIMNDFNKIFSIYWDNICWH